jgi:hypothetical protein
LISQPIRLTDADSRPHLQPNSILADVKLQRLDFEKKHRIYSNAEKPCGTELAHGLSAVQKSISTNDQVGVSGGDAHQ